METISIIKPAQNIIFETTNFFSFDKDVILTQFINKLSKYFAEFNTAYESFNIKNLNKKQAKKLLKNVSFLFSLFNYLGKTINEDFNYDNPEFWKLWNKTADNIENLYDELDVYTDDETMKLLNDINNGTFDKDDFIPYSPDMFQ